MQASNALPTGFLLFVAAWVMLVLISFGFPYETGSWCQGIFDLFPWAILAQGLQSLSDSSSGGASNITHLYGILILQVLLYSLISVIFELDWHRSSLKFLHRKFDGGLGAKVRR